MGKKRAMMIGLDGADPYVIKRLIDQGRLPHLKRVLENGVIADKMSMLGAFPSVTPPNWASLATGNWPKTHGVTCYWNQTEGKDLMTCEMNWDSRRVESDLIWEAFSREGKRSIMLNYCEAWPPRIKDDQYGVYVDGSGVVPFLRSEVDAPKVVTLATDCELKVIPHIAKDNASDCIVTAEMLENMTGDDQKEAVEKETKESDPFVDTPLIEFPFDIVGKTPKGAEKDSADAIISPLNDPVGWTIDLPEGAKVAVVPLADSTIRRFFVLTASDGKKYDTLTIYRNKKDPQPLGVVGLDKWSDPIRDVYMNNNEKVNVGYFVRLMNIKEDGTGAEILISHALNVDDYDYFYPRSIGKKMFDEVGPFMPQIWLSPYGMKYSKFELEIWEKVYKWHIDATHWLFKEFSDWQLFYVHLHGIDIYNHWYINQTLPGWNENYEHYQEMLAKMYEFNDEYVGAVLEYLDENTNIIITSDHAAIPNSPGDENPGIGFLRGIATPVMTELGYTVLVEGTENDPKPQIDWSKTTAVSSRLSNIYINLKGRDPKGIVEPEDYQKLVEKIISDLYSYRHPQTGKRVVAFCMTRDEMEAIGMGGKHCGDIFFQLTPTYCVTHGNVPSTVEHEEYSMNNLCMMIGADFKQNEKIRRVIRITDVVPTICYLCGNSVPSNCEGGVIWQALKGFEEEQFTREIETK